MASAKRISRRVRHTGAIAGLDQAELDPLIARMTTQSRGMSKLNEGGSDLNLHLGCIDLVGRPRLSLRNVGRHSHRLLPSWLDPVSTL
jgi:hypothetical protein